MDHNDFNGRVNKNCLVGAKRSKSCLNTTSNEAFASPLKSRSRTSSTESEVYEVVAESDNDECENETLGEAEHFTNHINELNNTNVNGNLNENPADDLYDSVEMDEEFVIVEDDGNDAVEEINNSQEQLSDSEQQSSLDNCNVEEINEECPVPRENAQCLKDPPGSALEKLPAAESKQSTSNALLSSEDSELTDEFLKERKEELSPTIAPLMKQSDEKTNLTNESDISKEGPDNVNVSEANLPPGGDSNSISTVGFEAQSFDDTGQDIKISIDNPTVMDYKVNCDNLHENNKTNISNSCSTEIFGNDSVIPDAQKDVCKEIEQNSVFKSKLLKSPSFSSSEDENFDLDGMILNIVDETSPEKKELAIPSSETNIDKVCSNLFESLSSVVQSSEPKSSVISDSEKNKSDFTITTELKPEVNSLISEIENAESDCVTLSELKLNVNNSISKTGDIESDFTTPELNSSVDSSISKNKNTESDCTPSELKPDINISIDKNENTESDFTTPSERKPDIKISMDKNENTESGFTLPSELKSNVNKLVNENDDIELDCITPELKPDVNNSINKNDIESGCVTLSQLIPNVNNNNLINEKNDIEPDCITLSEQKCDLTKSKDKNENSESGFTLASEIKFNVNTLLNENHVIESSCLTPSELNSNVNTSIHRNDAIESDCITPSELKPNENSSINKNDDFESGCVLPSELKLDINTSGNKSDDIESDCRTSSELKPDLNNSINENDSTESDFTNRTNDVSKNIQCSKANISDLDTSDKTNISDIDTSNCKANISDIDTSNCKANISDIDTSNSKANNDCDVSHKANISDFDSSHKALSGLDTSDEVNRSDLCASYKESISESDISFKTNTVDLDDSNEIMEINYFKLNDDKQTHNRLPKEPEATGDVSRVLSNTPTKEASDRNKQVSFPKTIGGLEVDIIEGLIKRGVCVAEDDFHISDSSTTSSDIFLTKLQTEEKDSRDNCLSPDSLKDSKSTAVEATTELKHNSALLRDDQSEEIECIEIVESKITSTAKAEKSVEVADDVATKVCKDPQLKEVDESAEIKTIETTVTCSESEMKPSDNFIEIQTAETDELEIVHDSGSKEINKHTTADKSKTMGHLTTEDEKISTKIKIEENDELENSSDIKSEKINEAPEIQIKETDEPKNIIKCEPLEPNESPEIPVSETDHSLSVIEPSAIEKISTSKEQQTAECEKSELVLDPAPKVVDQSQSMNIGRSVAENTSQGPTLSLEVGRESDTSEAGSLIEKNDKHFVIETLQESGKEFKVLSDSIGKDRDEILEKQISDSQQSETALSEPISEESDKTLEIKTLESKKSDVIIDLSFEAYEDSTEKPVFKTDKSESLDDLASKGNNGDLSTELHISKTGDSEAVIDSASEENDNSLKVEIVSESKESKRVLNLPSEENDKTSEIQNLLPIESEPLIGEKDSKCDSNDSLEVEILETASAAIHPKFKKIKDEKHDEDKVNTDVVNILDSTVKSAISELKAIVSQTNEHNLIDRDDILKLNAIKRKLDVVDNLAEIKKVKTEDDKNEEKSSAVNDTKKSKGEKRKRKLEDDEEEEEERKKIFASEVECNKIGDLSFMDMYKKHYKKSEEEAFRFLAEIKEQSERIANIAKKYTAEMIDFRDSQAELFRKHNYKIQIPPKKRTVGVNVKIYKEEDIKAYKQKSAKEDPDKNTVRIREDISIESKMEIDIDTYTEFKTEPKTEYSSPSIKVEQNFKPLAPKFNLKDTIITPVVAAPFAGRKQIVPRFITQTTRPILNTSLQSGRIPAPNVTVSGNRIISVGRPPVVLVPSNQLAASIKNQCIDLTKEENKLKITTAGVPMPTTVANVAMPGMPNTPNVLVPLRNCLQLLPSGSNAVNQQFNLPRQTLVPPFPSSILPGTRTVTYLVQQNSGFRARGIQPFIRPQNQQVQFLLRVTNPGPTSTVSPVVNTIARHVVPQRPVSSTVNPSSGLVLISHTSKHPAPFPKSPHYPDNKGKATPPKPSLKGSKNASGIVLSWNMCLLRNHANISSYQLFAYQEVDGPVDSSLWKKVGDVNALPLPMACTLTQFVDKNRYYFTVRAVDVYQRFGPFSDPVSILYEKEGDSCTKK